MTENKGDLISREALKEHKFLSPQVKVIGGRRCGKTREQIIEAYQKGWNDCIDAIIDNAPTVESDRPQGEWKHLGGDEWVCSECGHVITTEGSWEKPLSTGAYHCENCGADMRGGAKS